MVNNQPIWIDQEENPKDRKIKTENVKVKVKK